MTPWAYIHTKEKFDGPIFGWGEGLYTLQSYTLQLHTLIYTSKEKLFNLQSVKLTFLSFFQYKARIPAFFTSCKM